MLIFEKIFFIVKIWLKPTYICIYMYYLHITYYIYLYIIYFYQFMNFHNNAYLGISKDGLAHATVTTNPQSLSGLIWQTFISHLCKCTPSLRDIAQFCLLLFIVESHEVTCSFKEKSKKSIPPALRRSRTENLIE